MIIIFYFIWFLALFYSVNMIDWTAEYWPYYNRWRKLLFFFHLFFLIFSVGLCLTIIVKSSFGI